MGSKVIRGILDRVKSGEITPEQGKEMIHERMGKNVFARKIETFSEKEYADESGIFKALELNGVCKVSQMTMRSFAPYRPKKGQVVVAVNATAMNFMDLMCLSGMYPNLPEYPFVPGFECSGVVVAIGDEVSSVKVNDEVICLTDQKLGAHSTEICIDESLVYKKPKSVTFEEAAAYSVAYLTEAHVFHLSQIQKGEYVLIHNAAGGCGHLAVQMAVERGAIVIATCGSDKKFAFLKKLGATYCINYQTEDFENVIMNITDGRGVDVVVNSLPYEGIQKGFRVLAEGGRYVEVAIFGLKSPKGFDLSHMVDNQSFYSVNIRTVMYCQPDLFHTYVRDMLDAMEKRKYQIKIDKLFSFGEMKKAYQYLSDRKNCGKVVIKNEFFEEIIEHYGLNATAEDNRDAKNVLKYYEEDEIAIVGVSCRFAGIENKEQLWRNISEGVCTVEEISSDRWSKEKYYDQNRNNPFTTDCKWGGFLHGIDKFDPIFFGMTGKDAKLTDPQQRMFLEEAWGALEDAGYASIDNKEKSVGVFLGIGAGDYQEYMLSKNVPMEAQAFWGNTCSVSASRISYILNLTGPSIAVDTACSSSLVALHMACRSIKDNECEMALVGGAFTMVTPKFYIMCSNAGMLSNTGKCSAFGKDANGFVPGEGIAAILLKPYKKAISDHDNIYAVIKGSGVNQDGKTNGLTAPSALSQRKLLCSVYDKYRIDPQTISYIETHGTGTPLGDSIEIEALKDTFERYTKKENICAIGSVKANIGHTSMAAGLAGVIKVLMSMKNKQIAPQIHCEELNRDFESEQSPFFIPKNLFPWKTEEGQKRRAAVSSFGFGGVNAHVVLEEHEEEESKIERPYYLFVFSAKEKDALKRYLLEFQSWLQKDAGETSLYHIAYTLQMRRCHFQVRTAIIASSLEELISIISAVLKNEQYCIVKKNKIVEVEYRGDVQNDTKYYEYLERVKAFYLDGCNVDWNLFDENKNGKTVSLPTYSFAKESYWFEQLEVSKSAENVECKNSTRDMLLNLFQDVRENKVDINEASNRLKFQLDAE